VSWQLKDMSEAVENLFRLEGLFFFGLGMAL
jgi:hypothetical protein